MELKSILEALLFSSQKPVSAKDLRLVFLNTAAELGDDEQVQEFKGVKTNEITKVLKEMAGDYEETAGSYRLIEVAGAWQFATEPDYAPWIRTLVGEKQRPSRLSAPALETMAIVAYRQPITRSEIEQIRGVSVDGTMQKLLERGLVEQTGKAEVVGRPSLYGTTPLFLEYFGLANLEDLPSAEELRKIPVNRPESLATAGPGLATIPPEQLTLDEIGGAKENTASEIATSASVDISEEEEVEDEEEFDDEDDDEDDDEEDDEEEVTADKPHIVAGPVKDESESKEDGDVESDEEEFDDDDDDDD
ncbi:MAG: SMC-Scp complex subunit ScpB [Verrucomicrobiia bacterium]